jgi:NAD(P)-dependent dehydrogenase (short-subunit alcohol dehydrogenase family)
MFVMLVGVCTAQLLAAQGARIVLGGRNRVEIERTRRMIMEVHPGADVTCLPLDLADFQSVRRFVTRFRALHTQVPIHGYYWLCNVCTSACI